MKTRMTEGHSSAVVRGAQATGASATANWARSLACHSDCNGSNRCTGDINRWRLDGRNESIQACRGTQKRSFVSVRDEPRNRAAGPEGETAFEADGAQRLVLVIAVAQALDREWHSSA